jgi:hypothetical protein
MTCINDEKEWDMKTRGLAPVKDIKVRRNA